MSQEQEVEKTDLEESQTEEEQVESEETVEVDPLESAQVEAADWKDKFLRAHADFENSKRCKRYFGSDRFI